jgi:hypothetical protein
MLPAGPGDGSSGRTYCCATPATNRATNDRARHGASRWLCNGVIRKHCCRKTKQEQ